LIDNRVSKLNDKIKPEEITKAIKELKKMVKVQPMIVSQMRCYKEWHFSTDKIIRETVQFYFWNGKFPNIWNESLLVPLYKKGNKIDPSNYTGISISSNLGKLFNRVINSTFLFIKVNEKRWSAVLPFSINPIWFLIIIKFLEITLLKN
jgi:hypothetical protein